MTRLLLVCLVLLVLTLWLAANPSPARSSGGAVYEFEVNLS